MTVNVHGQMPPLAVGEMTIAPTAQALTFARARTSDGTRLLAVLAYNNAGVQGVDLSSWGSDPITVYQQHGYSAIVDFVEAQQDRQIIVYAPHAEEATVEDGPFLFVKAVTPTTASDPVQAMGRLLDYEVELALRWMVWDLPALFRETLARAEQKWVYADDVIERYIKSALASGDYLQPGDLVHIRVDQLGEIRIVIQ